jgi:hypothetical protein
MFGKVLEFFENRKTPMKMLECMVLTLRFIPGGY